MILRKVFKLRVCWQSVCLPIVSLLSSPSTTLAFSSFSYSGHCFFSSHTAKLIQEKSPWGQHCVQHIRQHFKCSIFFSGMWFCENSFHFKRQNVWKAFSKTVAFPPGDKKTWLSRTLSNACQHHLRHFHVYVFTYPLSFG